MTAAACNQLIAPSAVHFFCAPTLIVLAARFLLGWRRLRRRRRKSLHVVHIWPTSREGNKKWKRSEGAEASFKV